MAINLNKSGEENSKPLEEKKKLNLTKKDDTENVKIDLSKGNVDPKPTSSIPENQEKKNQLMLRFTKLFRYENGDNWR